MTQHIEEARKLEPEWRYEIQYGPEGEANYAWIYKGDLFVATMRTHHAVEIVKAISALAAAEERGMIEERERCKPKFNVGDEVIYSRKGLVNINATIDEYVEGWPRLLFRDGSSAIVRPSSLSAITKEPTP